MACKRSAVRSRLAPPAFAGFASYGSASHAVTHRSEASEGCRVVARRAKTGLGKPRFFPSLRANGSRECAPDDRLREAIHAHAGEGMDCFVAEFIIGPAEGGTRWLLAMTGNSQSGMPMAYVDGFIVAVPKKNLAA